MAETAVTRLRIAAAQYPLDALPSWDAYHDKLDRWVADAARNGASLLLFPEFFSLEITAFLGADVALSLPRSLSALQDVVPDFVALFQALAHRHDVHICAGSIPVRTDEGRYHNRSYLVLPDGRFDWQDKLQMTRFEHEEWGISAGHGIRVFDTAFGRVGIAICYDSEFPLFARRQVERGADIILVPSCTDTLAGYHRVRIGSQARALENQCYVVQSPLVGDCPWSAAVDVNVGSAGVYTPVDHGFPADGILARGEMNVAQWVYADLDLQEIARIRSEGQVFNFRDWLGQYAHVPAGEH